MSSLDILQRVTLYFSCCFIGNYYKCFRFVLIKLPSRQHAPQEIACLNKGGNNIVKVITAYLKNDVGSTGKYGAYEQDELSLICN
jgi:hypothetical protein